LEVQTRRRCAIALAAPWNALPRKLIDSTQKVYVDAVRDFLKTKGIDEPKIEIEKHSTSRSGRRWRRGSLDQRDELF
jgi:hypothetical protein